METTASKEIETLIESVGIHLSLRSLSVVCLFGFFFPIQYASGYQQAPRCLHVAKWKCEQQ